jgi:hypothetical protein
LVTSIVLILFLSKTNSSRFVKVETSNVVNKLSPTYKTLSAVLLLKSTDVISLKLQPKASKFINDSIPVKSVILSVASVASGVLVISNVIIC